MTSLDGPITDLAEYGDDQTLGRGMETKPEP